ncbi:HNH endonuclease [Ideonella sp. B7]|uniref:HNH endonuclease signature motif containing protein n=1 Tax=Ideonella benzenivorans TaxID=2831643 RepID=UPI001CED62EB|nr:HNH endonuclease signature motif containing protein [Ideonella benzenivorans]MCA6218818.1 HNH endonuclease [Ideonella benzenivorans]
MTSSPPKTLATLLQYGLADDFARKVHEAGLTVTMARALRAADLVSKYGLSLAEAQVLTESVRRRPIDPDVVNLLLQRSNFLCNVCKGHKGSSYILHHIVEYEKTQDNSYENLVVLCPTDHDLAHRDGLTLGITVDQLRRAKIDWERQVANANAQLAMHKSTMGSNVNVHGNDIQMAVMPVARQSLEILPQLRAKYPRSLRPEMTSVQFVQSQERCYLEITTANRVNDYLVDETSKRTDLAFISGHPERLLFDPGRSITENVHCFISDFDEVSIINCTDLFTHTAAKRIDDHWRQHGCGPGNL